MKPQAEMIEGPEAFERFREAAKKNALGSKECHSESIQQVEAKKEKATNPQELVGLPFSASLSLAFLLS